jgi:hypothetical protein
MLPGTCWHVARGKRGHRSGDEIKVFPSADFPFFFLGRLGAEGAPTVADLSPSCFHNVFYFWCYDKLQQDKAMSLRSGKLV